MNNHTKKFHDKVKGRKSRQFIDMNDLREMRRTLTRADRFDALVEYYTQTDIGRSEFQNSSHSGRKIEDVVEDLCKEMDQWESDGLPPSLKGGRDRGQGASGPAS